MNHRKKLVEQYPSVPQISVPDGTPSDPQNLSKLVEPYLDWILAGLEPFSKDILIRKQRTEEAHSQFVILRGRVAQMWLRFRHNTGD